MAVSLKIIFGGYYRRWQVRKAVKIQRMAKIKVVSRSLRRFVQSQHTLLSCLNAKVTLKFIYSLMNAIKGK